MIAPLRCLLLSAILLAWASDTLAIHPHKRKASVLEYTGEAAPPKYGFAVPSHTWGWFGVRAWPMHSCHTGYYGDKREWNYRQGY